MSTKIEWCEETWNPIIGCSHVSPGCDNCYAERMAGRLANMPQQHENYSKVVRWGQHPKTDMYYASGKWDGKTHLVESALEKPLRWKKPRTIFVCSMGDLFHESVEWNWITKVIRVIEDSPQHTFLILTKRPERMLIYFQQVWQEYGWKHIDNLWLGVTAENQDQADKRIPILLNIPAAKRFVSIEPMLSEVNIEIWIHDSNCTYDIRREAGCICSEPREACIDWVIVGGETGPNSRPMHPDWVRYVRDQCQSAGVPFFFKQWGEYGQGSELGGTQYAVSLQGDFVKYHDQEEWGLMVRKHNNSWHESRVTIMSMVCKKKAGHLLDRKEWRERP